MLQDFKILDKDSRKVLQHLSADKHLSVSREYIMEFMRGSNNISFQKLSAIIQNLVEEKFLIPDGKEYTLSYKALYYEELYREYKKLDSYYKLILPLEISLISTIVATIISGIFHVITSSTCG